MFRHIEDHKTKIIYIPLVVYWILLFVLTTIPGSQVPNVGMSDKLQHFAAYFILGILLALAVMVQEKFPKFKAHPYVSTWFLIAVYAGIDEIHQIFVPGRYADIGDWIADILGAAVALIVIAVFKKIDNDRHSPLRNGRVTID